MMFSIFEVKIDGVVVWLFDDTDENAREKAFTMAMGLIQVLDDEYVVSVSELVFKKRD
jgi:hypothetical protein